MFVKQKDDTPMDIRNGVFQNPWFIYKMKEMITEMKKIKQNEN